MRRGELTLQENKRRETGETAVCGAAAGQHACWGGEVPAQKLSTKMARKARTEARETAARGAATGRGARGGVEEGRQPRGRIPKRTLGPQSWGAQYSPFTKVVVVRLRMVGSIGSACASWRAPPTPTEVAGAAPPPSSRPTEDRLISSGNSSAAILPPRGAARFPESSAQHSRALRRSRLHARAASLTSAHHGI